jgi:hypothetical protein
MVPCELRLKVVQCDQTSVFATSIMLPSEEVGRPLQRPSFHLQMRLQHGNPIDRSVGSDFARRRGLGILSLAWLKLETGRMTRTFIR